jgi:hypothetical protein
MNKIKLLAGAGSTHLAFALLLISLVPVPAQSLIETNTASPTLEPGRIVGGGSVAGRALANQANDPTAPLTLIEFAEGASTRVPGFDSPGNLFQIQPVTPIFPSKIFPFEQLLKLTIPFPTTPNPGSETGLGDISFFDLASIKQSWGRWGVGPAFVFPSATDTGLGQGKWQAGPALAVIYTGNHSLTAGFTAENPISFAGSPGRPDANALFITPTLTWNLPENWFAGYSDFDFVFDWENSGRATVPVGAQVGRVFSICKVPVSLSIEGAANVVKPSNVGVPDWQFNIEFTIIFKTFRHSHPE